MTRALEINPNTKFLESVNPATKSFTSEKKLKALQMAHECLNNKKYPSLDLICKSLDIGLKTFHNHLERDEVFRNCWVEIKARIDSMLTSNLALKAEGKMGTLAVLALLKANESGLINKWNQEQTINHVTDNSSSKTLLSGINDYIEADIIDDNKQLNAPESAK
jgi:hypothetical protein